MGRALRYRPGGIAGLEGLLRVAGGAVEADLQRYYGVRLSGLATGELTHRRLRTLLRHLPWDSATAAATRPDGYDPGEHNAPAREWTRVEHLLAGIYDSLQGLAWQNANAGAKSRSPKPKPLPRPGISGPVTYGKPRPISEVKAILASTRPGAGPPEPEEGGS